MAVRRAPAVAGRFYASNPNALRKDVNSYLSAPEEKDRVSAIGCIAPHAGYIYSGQVAGAVFSRLKIPPSCIVLCPNHTGRGHPLAIMKDGEWRTPLGTLPIDSALAARLLKSFPALVEDHAAHHSDHALEVELPFLQVSRPGVRFVPVAIGTGQLLILEQLGRAIAGAVQASEEPLLIIASTDMNHSENHATTRPNNANAIDTIMPPNPP